MLHYLKQIHSKGKFQYDHLPWHKDRIK